MTKNALLAGLRAILPADCLIEDQESQRPFECDGLLLYRELPLLVALPETVAQIQSVLKCCHQLGVPVVARGSGTGLCAGAMPHPEGVLLGLSKLNNILEVDPKARTARLQPGVTNLAISEAAAAHGLYYGP
ncbi:MAG: FAD-binding protein, partial [Halioglobus sp.]|nr:FAD-binding protein [Halioglobus sp.]